MDSSMLITLSTIILAAISLIVFIQRKNTKNKKKIFSVLQSFASEHNSIISSYDHWDKTTIGIDNNGSNKLFFTRTILDKELKEVINLKEVIKCQLNRTERTILFRKEKVNVIDKIELVFSFANHYKPNIALEFYNSEYDHLTLSGELQFAQKWSGIITNILIENKNLEIAVNKARLKAPSLINEPIVNGKAGRNSVKRKNKHVVHELDIS